MNIKKTVAGAVAFSVLMTAVLPVYATAKEEVIYVKANSDGSVKSVYAVNSFDGGDVTDYGDYTDLKLLNIDGDIIQNGDEISFSLPDNKKIYYQGTVKNAELPWNISMRYFLDGKEMSADEIGGASGRLEIKINISENENANPSFYKNYALQCNLTLDTEICKNIAADGATVANVGSKKQITYTALPGNGLERSVCADVTDFEMPSAEINGIRMNLGLDIEYDGSIADIANGVKELDDGAESLYTGSTELNDGVSGLNGGIEKLHSGIDKSCDGLSQLNSKSDEFRNGSAEVKKALLKIKSSLSAVSGNVDALEKTVNASAQIKSAIESLCDGVAKLKAAVSYDGYKSALGEKGLDTEALKAQNEQAIAQLNSQIAELKAAVKQMENSPQNAEKKAELNAQAAQLENIAALLSGNNAMLGGTQAYFDNASKAAAELETGIVTLSSKYAEFDKAVNTLVTSFGDVLVNASALANGIDTLMAEYEKLDGGISEYTDGVKRLYDGLGEIQGGVKALADGGTALADGTAKLVDGTTELSRGTGEFRKKSEVIDDAKVEKLDDMLNSITEDYDVVSFVSDKNTDVKTVQFVIITDAIKTLDNTEEVMKTEEKSGFWQKFLHLFGID